MNYCPCCTDTLLRHLDRRTVYWFCSQCRQKMPVKQNRQELDT